MYFPSARKARATIATPHPAVAHASAMAAFVIALAATLAWVAGVSLPLAVAVVAVGAFAGCSLAGRVRRRLIEDPRAELSLVYEPWIGCVVSLVAAVVAYDIERRASLGSWTESVLGAAVGGGLLLLLPAGLMGTSLGARAAEGGPLPPSSRARKAIALAPWRCAMSWLAPVNFVGVLPAMGHAKAPLTSVGSVLSFACLVGSVYVLLAQRCWLSRSPALPEPMPPTLPETSLPATRRGQRVEVPETLRKTLARRELRRGLLAFGLALAVASLHVVVLFA